MDFLLITPPLLQLNTPYSATPVLTDFLRQHGLQVKQRDLSIELALKIFTPETIRAAEKTARSNPKLSSQLEFFLEQADDYCRTIGSVIAFLQGKQPQLAWMIACRNLLPEGPSFRELDPDDSGDNETALRDAFGTAGIVNQAKYLASLYLDDLSSFISQALDADFAFGRYAENLCLSLPSLDPLLLRLQKTTYIDRLIDELAADAIRDCKPRFIGLAVPFPGTLYAAFRIARTIRRLAPDSQIVLGGGFVNSELRNLTDDRVFDFFHFISYDDGCLPLLSLAESTAVPVPETALGSSPDVRCRLRSRNGFLQIPDGAPPAMLAPDYDGLNLGNYFSVTEMPNPMHSLWTDGTWLKMQLAQGCYWHKCAFCDLALDYIGHYAPADPKTIVDKIQQLVQSTGQCGFHFVDEALAPALIRGFCTEIVKRDIHIVWWGNIRFDNAFDWELVYLMAQSGCIAVTGGLECANDRLLKLMNKGITLQSARNALELFHQAGIMVHTYLMYAFPTETQAEALNALEFVRDCFADGLITSAFWHRFALTAHSAIARTPAKFGITVPSFEQTAPRFALNEIPYFEKNSSDWDRIGRALSTALYNYMLGLGLDLPARHWLPR